MFNDLFGFERRKVELENRVKVLTDFVIFSKSLHDNFMYNLGERTFFGKSVVLTSKLCLGNNGLYEKQSTQINLIPLNNATIKPVLSEDYGAAIKKYNLNNFLSEVKYDLNNNFE